MTQTNVPAAPGAPRFCSACGGALPGPAQRCPRCGAAIARASSNRSAIAIIIIAVAVFGAIPCIGILAAIAIPNFVRYQLRAKEAGVKAELASLAKAEQAQLSRTGRFLALGPLPSAAPGSQKSAFSGEELKAAADIDWMVQPTTYGQYRVAVSESGAAASLCAESDIDGDGTRAVHVVFLPPDPRDAAGVPPAPCTNPVPYDPQLQPGEVLRITEPNVF